MAIEGKPWRSSGIEKFLEMFGNDIDRYSSAGSKKLGNVRLSHGCFSHQSVKNSIPEKELMAAHGQGLGHGGNATVWPIQAPEIMLMRYLFLL
jgi:hypothetical protein